MDLLLPGSAVLWRMRGHPSAHAREADDDTSNLSSLSYRLSFQDTVALICSEQAVAARRHVALHQRRSHAGTPRLITS